MALQTGTIVLNKETLWLTGSSWGSGNVSYYENNAGIVDYERFGYEVEVSPDGATWEVVASVQTPDGQTQPDNFAISLVGKVLSGYHIRARQYSDWLYDSTGGNAGRDYTEYSNVIVIDIKLGIPTAEYSLETNTLSIKVDTTEPCHADINPLAGYEVYKADGSAYELFVPMINTTAKNTSGSYTLPAEKSVVVSLDFTATYIKVTGAGHTIIYDASFGTDRHTYDGETKYFTIEGGYVNATGFKFWTQWNGGTVASWTATNATYLLPLTITENTTLTVVAVYDDGRKTSPSEPINITYSDIQQVSIFAVPQELNKDLPMPYNILKPKKLTKVVVTSPPLNPIRIIDTNFNLLGEIDNYSSLQWTRRWHKPGEFELHINPDMANADKLQEDTIIFLAEKSTEAGVIKHRQIEVDVNGEETLVVKGKMLAGLTDRRITVPTAGKAYDYQNAKIETIMKHYVTANCIFPTDAKRIIPNLINSTDQQRGSQIQFQSQYQQLDEELEKLSLQSGIGWHIWLDVENKKYVFDVLVGRDLTTNQSALPPAIFSVDFDNIEAQSFINSAVGYKNAVIIGGQGEGTGRKITSLGDAAGLSRYETFVDAGDIGTGETGQEPLTDAQVNAMLLDRGREVLAENERIMSLESKILTNSNLKYRTDYDLGDIVTVVNRKWGVLVNTRITEIKEIYEENGFSLEAVFGTNVPTLVEKIKRTIRR